MHNWVRLMLNSANPEYNATNKIFSRKFLFKETVYFAILFVFTSHSEWCTSMKCDQWLKRTLQCYYISFGSKTDESNKSNLSDSILNKNKQYLYELGNRCYKEICGISIECKYTALFSKVICNILWFSSLALSIDRLCPIVFWIWIPIRKLKIYIIMELSDSLWPDCNSWSLRKNLQEFTLIAAGDNVRISDNNVYHWHWRVKFKM